MSDTAPATEHPSTPTTATPVASATGLEIRIPDGPVLLHPASLTVRAGQVTALTGPSGSGKTTLLRALIGHLPDGAAVTAGTLDVLGHSPSDLGPADLRLLRRNRIAYVGQDPGSALNPRMKIRSIVAETAGDPSDEAVLGLLRECRLPVDDGLPDRRPTAISGGQQRRVALARALARTPEILLLDEPTAGLDSALRDEIAELLRDLAASRGLAVVMACHDPELVEACADHVVRLTAPRPVHLPSQRAAAPDAGPLSPVSKEEGKGCARRASASPSATAPGATRPSMRSTSALRPAPPPASSAPRAPARPPCSASWRDSIPRTPAASPWTATRSPPPPASADASTTAGSNSSRRTRSMP